MFSRRKIPAKYHKKMKNSVLFIAISVFLTSCDGYSIGEGAHVYGVKTIEHENHKYVIYRTENGCSIIHEPSCCKKE